MAAIGLACFAALLLLLPLVHVWHYPCWLVPSQRHDLRQIMVRSIALLAEADIPFVIADGTLLGIVREHDQIKWDLDVDVNIPYAVRNKFFEAVHTDRFRAEFLTEPGVCEPASPFRCCKLYQAERYDQSDLVRFFYKRLYIDVCTVREDIPQDRFRLWFPPAADGASGYNLTTLVDRYGNAFPAPNPPQRVLESMYGPDYMRPHLADDGGDGYNSFTEACPKLSVLLEKVVFVLAIMCVILQITLRDALSLPALLALRRKRTLTPLEFASLGGVVLIYAVAAVLGLFVLFFLLTELPYTSLTH